MCLVPESEDTEAELRLLRHEAEPLESCQGGPRIWRAIMPAEAKGLSSGWFSNRMLTVQPQSVWALGGLNI